MSSNKITHIRIHPGIGIARVGNSDEFYIGPEAPGIVVDPGKNAGMKKPGPGPGGGSYRDSKDKLKRQAQRFRVYGYDAKGNVVGELNIDSADVIEINWRVHVRNMKAANYAFQGAYLYDPEKFRNPSIQGDKKLPIERDELIIDPGPQTIGTANQQHVVLKGDIFTDSEGTLPGYLKYECYEPADPSKPVNVKYKQAKNIEIGQLHLDDKQRLLFVASPGKSKCVTTPKTELSNPSESHNAPNGPYTGRDPLTDQFAYFNVPGWWDDTCGGEIDVTIKIKDENVKGGVRVLTTRDPDPKKHAEKRGWVVTAPPKYSPYMYHVVSILDRVYETFPESNPHPPEKGTHFYRDIHPILFKACNYGWVSEEAAGVDPTTRNLAHGPNQAGNLLREENMRKFTDKHKRAAPARKQIYAIMRHADASKDTKNPKFPKLVDTLMPPPPLKPTSYLETEPLARGNKMPKLWGTGGKPLQNQQRGADLPNQYLSLTDWQLEHMWNWSEGKFYLDEKKSPIPLEDYSLNDQPRALDESALEPTIGGGFHPGIEFPYLIIYREKFEEAFRVRADIEPGSVAAFMSSPWQGDYWSCNIAWWPVQRPDIVFDVKHDGSRTYKQWFRGFDSMGEPLSSTDGYNQMVYAWDKLGMVLPVKNPPGSKEEFKTQKNEMIFQEFERDSTLNSPPPKRKKVDCSKP